MSLAELERTEAPTDDRGVMHVFYNHTYTAVCGRDVPDHNCGGPGHEWDWYEIPEHCPRCGVPTCTECRLFAAAVDDR